MEKKNDKVMIEIIAKNLLKHADTAEILDYRLTKELEDMPTKDNPNGKRQLGGTILISIKY